MVREMHNVLQHTDIIQLGVRSRRPLPLLSKKALEGATGGQNRRPSTAAADIRDIKKTPSPLRQQDDGAHCSSGARSQAHTRSLFRPRDPGRKPATARNRRARTAPCTSPPVNKRGLPRVTLTNIAAPRIPMQGRKLIDNVIK